MMSMNPLNLHDPSSRGLDAAAATPSDDGGAFSYASPGGLGGFGAAGSGMQFSSFFEDAASASAGGGGDAKSAGAGGGGAELIDDDAWAAVFGPRSPPLVPPGARAAPPPVGHPYGGGGAATAKEAPSAAKGHARTSSGADFVAEENGEDKPSIVAGEYASGTTGDAWTPRGVLVAHLTEHRGAVNAVAASDDGAFFVTGSDDGCLKAWDVANAERDAFFRSRATYGGHRAGASASASASDAACKITAAAALSDDGHTICSTADDGSVHAWRVELAAGSGSGSGSGPPGSRPASASEVARASPNEGACSAVIKLSANVACVATERGGLRGWDLRAPLRGDRDRGRGTLGNAFAVDVPPRLGAVTCVVAEAGASPRWTCHGTSAGALCLVDARFGLSVAEWRHPHGAYSRVDAIALGVDGVGAGHKNDAALVWAAAGGDELALWDVGVGACRRVARVLRPPSETTARTMPSSLRRGGRLTRAAATCGDPRAWAKAKAGGGGGVEGGGGGGGDEDGMLDFRVDDLKETTGAPRSEGARCLFSLPNGALLAGGGDACVRLWCPLEPARGRVVHGPLGRNDRPKHEEVYASNLPVAQERPSASVEAAAAGAGLRAGGDGGVAEAIASAAGRHDCHRDAVLAMCVTGFGTGRVLVTGGRDAAVKVWK
jgi:phosphoinositide-3-kinase regulatory subunit 4